MRLILTLGLVLILALSCNKDGDDEDFKRENGTVWLSGGFNYCAEQIHLDNGDTLTTPKGELLSFKSGDRVDVKYSVIGANENCTSYLVCEIIEIKKTE